MTLPEFAGQISRELTASCVLPVTVPPKEIERIIKQSEKWFYKNYEQAVEEKFIVVPVHEFQKPGWKKKREFKMDDCVVAITEAPREMKGAGLFMTFDLDMTDDKFIASEIFLSPNNGDELVMMTARMSFWDLSKAYMLETIAFTFNENTKILHIKGHDPRCDVLIRYAAKIPPENLYDDYYFQRYVTGKTKIALGTILGTYSFNLIGGVTINYSEIKSEGKDEVEEIKTEIQGQQTADWFMVWH